jgi:hypothetical protein
LASDVIRKRIIGIVILRKRTADDVQRHTSMNVDSDFPAQPQDVSAALCGRTFRSSESVRKGFL